MNIGDFIDKQVDKSKPDYDLGDPEKLLDTLEIPYYNYTWKVMENLDKEIKRYPIKRWICTDTHVGYNAYYLKDVLICISEQVARKWDIAFYFVSEKAFKDLREHALKQLGEPDIDIQLVDLKAETPKEWL